MDLLNEVLITPFLANFGVLPQDPTFGRYLLDTSQTEIDFEARQHISTRRRRVFFKNANVSSTKIKGYAKSHIEAPAVGNATQQEYVRVEEGEDVNLTKGELASGQGRQWVFYKVWESNTSEARNSKARGCDVVFSHGMSDYGAKYIPHIDGVLEMGFRVIVPDLPSHGRSTGVHVHLDSPFELTEGVHAVLTDVQRWSESQARKTFLSGSSLGGWTSLAYALRYPDPPTPLSGVFVMAPLIGIAPESMPPYPVYLLALVLRRFAGRLPLSPAVKGNISDDPRVEAEDLADPRCYHGDVRIATGLSLLRGLASLQPSAARLNVPLRIVHGSNDRTTDHSRSVEFAKAVLDAGRAYGHDPDASCEIYQGYEHVMLKVGIDAADDQKRQGVLRDLESWFAARV